jgi:Lrp/AsnC family transcriptional regulator for asnA, asnC and gidA
MKDKPKTDLTDAKILKILLNDSRISLTEMSKHCGITVGAVRMRILRLRKTGIIRGEIMLVNPHSLGYKCVVDLGIITTAENEKEIEDFLRSKPFKYANIVGPFGKYNVFAVIALKNIQELSKILEELESNPHVRRVESLIWAEAINMEHMEKLVLKPLEEEKAQVAKNHAISLDEVQIDAIDRKIAKILSQNARTPFNKIAKQIGLSTKTVIQRYKKLKGTVLTHSTIVVDLEKLGFKAFAFIFIKVGNRSKMPEIFAKLLQVPNLVVALKTIGPYDLNVDVFVSSFKELFEATEQIRKIPGIELVDTYVTPPWNEWPPNLFVSLL